VRGKLSILLVVAALTTSEAATAPGTPRIRRMVRTFDWSTGFPASYTSAVQQDADGFLWVSSPSGLILFDGTRARIVRKRISMLAQKGAADGRLLVTDVDAHTFVAKPSGFVVLDAGAPALHPNMISVALTTDDTPWRARDGIVEYLAPQGGWVSVPVPDADPLLRVYPGRGGRMYASSNATIWEVSAASGPREVAKVDYVLTLLERADGTIVAGTNQGPSPITTRVFAIAHGAVRVLYEERAARFCSVAERDDTVWIAMDTALQGIGPDGEPRGRIAPPSVPATCGQILPDREGSLWIATPRGLVQIPDPDVWAVAPPSEFALRQMVRTKDGVWATFWGSLLFVTERSGEPHVSMLPSPHYAGLCTDDDGRVWTGFRMGLLTPPMTFRPVAPSVIWDPLGCSEGRGGRRWIAAGPQSLWSVSPGESAPHLVVPLPEKAESIQAAAEDPSGVLWVAVDSRVCRVPAAQLVPGAHPAWICEETGNVDGVVDLEVMPSGDVWALTPPTARMLRRFGGRWEPHPGGATLPSGWPVAIEPSPKGGVWLVGFGYATRVRERRDLPAGWEVLETLTAWQGLTWINVSALTEDADGTLWLGADAGVVRIPAAVRARRPDPPTVALIETSVDGSRLDASLPVRLPFRRNRLEARFAAPSFRDPEGVVFRARLRAGDPWSAPSHDGAFQFVDLAPGTYDLEVAASRDRERWSAKPARLSFRVLRPWYLEPWFLSAAVIAVAGSAHLGYRLRMRRRLALERQRARIAMDLHDEVGSGLGTIAVLAGITGRADLPEERRAEVAGRIAGVSQELAHSLGDIVWSLRASSGSLDALWAQLLDRARPLFADGTPRLTVEAPEPVPSDALSLVVRRNLHLLALEALHNAARHAGASVVALRLAHDGALWRLEVEDDGRGIGPEAAPARTRRGLGLTAMRARAEDMGGTIAWESAEKGGTRVVVRFRASSG